MLVSQASCSSFLSTSRCWRCDWRLLASRVRKRKQDFAGACLAVFLQEKFSGAEIQGILHRVSVLQHQLLSISKSI